jgi:hypothetical protein
MQIYKQEIFILKILDNYDRKYKMYTSRKDYYLLVVNDVSLGEFEKSDLRHIIEVIDNSI